MSKRLFVSEGGTIKVRIIAPGQGSSAYYEAPQLERDHPVFRGRPVFWNHQTAEEERKRPEGDLTDLIGKITETTYEKTGPMGEGAYGVIDVVPYYREVIDSVAPYAGLSIRAFGDRTEKVVSGAKKMVAEKFSHSRSVDFVTEAGAGGVAVPMMESARSKADESVKAFREAVPSFIEGDGKTELDRFVEWASGDTAAPTQEVDMAEQEKLTALETEIASLKVDNQRLTEAAVLREAQEIVVAEVAKETTLPEITRTRLVESLKPSAPMKEGKLDADALKALVAVRVKDEKAYLESLTKSKRITGMGGGEPDDGGKKKLRESMIASFMARGDTKEKAEALADLAVRG